MANLNSWKGVLAAFGFETIFGAPRVDLHLAAAETNGECRFDLWPEAFVTTNTAVRTGLLDQVWSWTHGAGAAFPLCTFMPERLPDANLSNANKLAFRNLSQQLASTQSVLFVQWSSLSQTSIPGAGFILFPSPHSHAVMTGALFLASDFPDQWLAASIDPSPYGAQIVEPFTGGYGSAANRQVYYHLSPTAPSSASTSTGSDGSWPATDAPANQ